MNRKSRTVVRAIAACAAVAFASPAFAQSMTITPTKGQSAAQVEQDKADCNSIAQQSAASSAPAPAAPQRGGRLKGAAVGAAVGAGTANRRGGEAYDRAPDKAQDQYRENQAKNGAAAGMVAGGVAQRRGNREAAANQQAAGAQATDSAFRSCLMGRGYNVQ